VSKMDKNEPQRFEGVASDPVKSGTVGTSGWDKTFVTGIIIVCCFVVGVDLMTRANNARKRIAVIEKLARIASSVLAHGCPFEASKFNSSRDKPRHSVGQKERAHLLDAIASFSGVVSTPSPTVFEALARRRRWPRLGATANPHGGTAWSVHWQPVRTANIRVSEADKLPRGPALLQ
jgi:hypothetical protein